MNGAGYESVCVAHFDHHHTEVHGVFYKLCSLFMGHALRFAQFIECIGIRRELVAASGINNLNALQIDGARDVMCLLGVAEECDLGDAARCDFGSRFDGSGFFALRQHDVLDVGLCSGDDFVD